MYVFDFHIYGGEASLESFHASWAAQPLSVTNGFLTGIRHFTETQHQFNFGSKLQSGKDDESSGYWTINSSVVYTTVFFLTEETLWMTKISNKNMLGGKTEWSVKALFTESSVCYMNVDACSEK